MKPKSQHQCVPVGLFLPVGFPETVSPDYLAYQLWAVPSHITGWMGGSLITSSLLAAVGIKAGAGQAAGAAASIRWITKDGIGALGRLLVSLSLTVMLLAQTGTGQEQKVLSADSL